MPVIITTSRPSEEVDAEGHSKFVLSHIKLAQAIDLGLSAEELTTVLNTELAEKGLPPINKKIDGVGIRLCFEVEGEQYVIIGNSRGEALSVFGGKVEDHDANLMTRLMDRIENETFKMFELHRDVNGWYLTCLRAPKTDFPLEFSNTMHLDDHAGYKMAYLQCSASVKGFTLEMLTAIAAEMTPTASMWNIIGNYLHAQRKGVWSTKKPEDFQTFWASQQESRNKLYETLQPILQEASLFSLHKHPAFAAASVEDGFEKFKQAMDSLPDAVAFWAFKDNIIGSHSERPSLYVVRMREMRDALSQGREVRTVNGKLLGKVFDARAVACSECVDGVPSAAAGLAEHSQFPQEEPTAAPPTEEMVRSNTVHVI